MRYNDDFRQSHVLRSLVEDSVPSNLMFIDTETIATEVDSVSCRSKQTLRLWTAEAMRWEKGDYSRDIYADGTRPEEFWHLVDKRTDNNRVLWIFAHNLGFDFTVLRFWQQAENGRYKFRQKGLKSRNPKGDGKDRDWVGIMCLEDPPTILKFRLGDSKRTIMAVDTFNFFRCSLAKLGESVGSLKCEMPDPNAPDEQWLEYCRNDTRIVRKVILKLLQFVVGNNCGSLAFTSSGQAMNAYRRMIGEGDTPIIIHGNARAIEIERKAYHGGICLQRYCGHVVPDEVFVTRPETYADTPCLLGPIYVYDVNSFYPYVMKTSKYPCKLVEVGTHKSVGEIAKMLGQGYCVAAECMIDCGPPGYPVTRCGKTGYCCGKFYTFLCGPELERGLLNGDIKRIGRYAVYEGAYIFAKYVDKFYGLRKSYQESGNIVFADMCKLMLNSVYGKFAQKRHKWEDRAELVPPIPFGIYHTVDLATRRARTFRAVAWNVQEKVSIPSDQSWMAEHDDSFPLISAYVTAYGREYMLSLFDDCGWNNLLYSDTDSLHVLRKGHDNLQAHNRLIGPELGQLKLIGVYQHGEYRARKDYTLEHKEVIAGVSGNAVKVGDRRYEQVKFSRVAYNVTVNRCQEQTTETVLVDMSTNTPFGSVGVDGWISWVYLSDW